MVAMVQSNLLRRHPMSEQIKMLASRGIEEVWNRGNFEIVD
jgi:hypothetical protein